MKNKRCQFWKRCKLKRECAGCQIPARAKEDEYTMKLKTSYIRETDNRGVHERADMLKQNTAVLNSFYRMEDNDDEE